MYMHACVFAYIYIYIHTHGPFLLCVVVFCLLCVRLFYQWSIHLLIDLGEGTGHVGMRLVRVNGNCLMYIVVLFMPAHIHLTVGIQTGLSSSLITNTVVRNML